MPTWFPKRFETLSPDAAQAMEMLDRAQKVTLTVRQRPHFHHYTLHRHSNGPVGFWVCFVRANCSG
jgi:hypothetical protein